MKVSSISRNVFTFTACLAWAAGASASSFQDPAQDLPGAPEVDTLTGSAIQAAGIEFADARVLYNRQVHLPFSGVTATFLKLRDARTGEEQRVVLDQNMKPLDYDELMELEEGIRSEIYGCMHPDLHRRILAGSDEALVEVMVKLRVNEDFVDKSGVEDGSVSRESLRQRSEQVRAQVEANAKSLLTTATSRYGFVPFGELNADGPFVVIALPASTAMALAHDPDIAFIGPAGETPVVDVPSIPESLPTTRTDSMHGYSRGSGVKIAVLESGQATTPQGCFRVSDRYTSTGAFNSHMTKSMGIIGSKYNGGTCAGGYVGYAPDASIIMANSTSYKDNYAWSRTRGVDVVTMSWHYPSEETTGSLHSRDEYFDYWSTRFPYPSVFASAGNQASSLAYASGKGYNFFGVGNVINEDDDYRCDDYMSSSSSWRDPISTRGDREIPEIAAPGSTHEVLGGTFGGTSCATPVAASIAACLIGVNPSLRYWPEGVRAILMATANYQDADGMDFRTNRDGKDGTGMLDSWYAALAGKIRANNTSNYYRGHDYGSVNKWSFNGSYLNETWKAYTYTTNAKIRVALTWNSRTTSSNSVLDADLDLRVYAPNGTLVAWSSSFDNNNEFVEFKPTQTGAYTIKVRGYNIPLNFSSYFGVAWTTMYDCQ